MKGFASISKPMTQLTGKNVKFVWSKECEKSFQKLKERLTESPVLALPRTGVPYVVTLTHRDQAWGVCLCKKIEPSLMHPNN